MTVRVLFLAISVVIAGLLLAFVVFVACTAAILDVNQYPADPNAPTNVTGGDSGGSR